MKLLIPSLILLFSISCQQTTTDNSAKTTPNILLIVADDMGYADLGCFGSDILTPNIDQLAAEGVRFTNFYSAPSCAPTRASLLTGADNHMAGVGSQFNRTGDQWGYEGFLSDRVVTIPQLLSDHGYHTSMVGKWHLGGEQDQLAHSKGFQNSFVLHQGGGNHYNNVGFVATDAPSIYSLNGQEVPWPEGAYSTDLYTDYLIDFIDEGSSQDKPFFALGAYTSPHWPLQVDSSYWTKYEANYVDGYETLREKRLASLKATGIISPDHQMPPLHPGITPWDSLSIEEQKSETRKMALYAGMLENLDANVGRLIAHLKEIGQYDNTLIIFMSDNGAAYRDFYASGPFKEFLQANYDNGYGNMGEASSFVSYGPGWAEAGSAPFRYYKQYTFEGGIRVPMIIRDPTTQHAGSINKSFATLTDIAPTFYELAQAPFPAQYDGQEIHPLQGKSILPLVRGDVDQVHGDDEAWTMEHHHHVLVRKGKWKLINTGMGWEESKFALYNIIADPTESTDIKENHPEKYQELLAVWKTFKQEYKVTAYDAGDE
jgi:arylsulfatase